MQESHIQLHMFSDASQEAYGAVIYLNAHPGDAVLFMAGKSRVVPLYSIDWTIPQDLIAAATAASLMIKARSALGRPVNQIYMWTDSTTVLTWIESTLFKLKSFVKHQVQRFKRLTECFPCVTWKFCPTLEIPADFTFRGIKLNGKHGSQMKLWLEGSTFL